MPSGFIYTHSSIYCVLTAVPTTVLTRPYLRQIRLSLIIDQPISLRILTLSNSPFSSSTLLMVSDVDLQAGDHEERSVTLQPTNGNTSDTQR